MNDTELRDKLAEKWAMNHGPNELLHTERIFKAGWDAARTCPLHDEKKLWDENNFFRSQEKQLRKTCDELHGEIIHYKNEYKELRAKFEIAKAVLGL